jgi:hypothetical protein
VLAAWLLAFGPASPAGALDPSSPFSNPAYLTPLLVTSDGAGTHTTTPGVPATFAGQPSLGPLNVDGVAELTIFKGAVQVFCTGTLMQGGTALVTAAHCVTDGAGTKTVTSMTAKWNLPGGVTVISPVVGPAGVTVHPGWNGNFAGVGNDIAIVNFGAPINPSVPRYDINRSLADVSVGDPRVKVGYGLSGIGSTGATLINGIKRAGLNSFDGLWVNANIVASDFDSGLAANDAIGLAFGVNHLGLGIHEVGSASGDSGGPTFFQANDSQLSLSAGANLGRFIVGNVPPQSLTATKTGGNSTDYSVTYTGDHANSNVASVPFVAAGDLSNYKIAAITSAGGRLNNDPDNNGIPDFPQPDVDGVTNFSWGEVNIDTRVSSFQAFIDPFLGPQPGPANQSVPLSIDDATPGDKNAAVTIDNLATTSEFAGTGSADVDDAANFTATVLVHANASFSGGSDANTLTLDFGTVPLLSSPAGLAFNIHNLEAFLNFTADLDLDSITPAGDFSMFNTMLAPFAGLDAGLSLGFLATIVTTTPGSFSATYTLGTSDEDIPGALNGAPLVLTLIGEVTDFAVPEPSTLALLGLGIAGVAIRRRIKRESA